MLVGSLVRGEKGHASGLTSDSGPCPFETAETRGSCHRQSLPGVRAQFSVLAGVCCCLKSVSTSWCFGTRRDGTTVSMRTSLAWQSMTSLLFPIVNEPMCCFERCSSANLEAPCRRKYRRVLRGLV